MAGLELISPEGLRIDGRRNTELRKLQCKKGLFEHADGSAYFEQGNTKVIASVYGPHEVTNRSKALHDSVVLNFQYSMASFSTSERKKRTKNDRKSKDISLILQKTFSTVIMKELYPRSQIDIYVQTLQADGSCVAACINAATIALIDAGVPIKDYICASTATYVQQNYLTDINHLEEGSGASKLTIGIMPRSEKIVLFEIDSKVHVEFLEKLIYSSKQACLDIFAVMQEVVDRDSIQQATTLVV